MASRVDLHVHSKFSDRPTEWILRRIGSPECYTEPEAIYKTAKRRGMQFVTISDHNCIQGALEIAITRTFSSGMRSLPTFQKMTARFTF
jgi:predicted metal-dependent phosphoesterase TrpH